MQRAMPNALFDLIQQDDHVVATIPTGEGDLLVTTASGRMFILVDDVIRNLWIATEQFVELGR